jgi:multicomponent Na+:H+ antiporter subunit D
MMTGTLNFDDLASQLTQGTHTAPIKAALAFFTIGLLLKMGVFPLHLWLANGYTNAPSFVSVFLSATATKVMVFVLIRIIYQLFGYEFSFEKMPLEQILITFSLLGIIVGSLVAVFQNNTKRLLAYSSVAQIGYILLGIGLASATGLVASITHIIGHGMAKAALFMALGCVFFRVKSTSLIDCRGIAKSMPWTMAAFVLAGLSLIGAPGTAGFISKWYLILALIEKDLYWVMAIILLSSLLAIMYIWRVVEAAYFQENRHEKITEAPLSMLVPLWIMVIGSYFFGIFTNWTVGSSLLIASTLLGGNQ